ncbi:MAG: isoprenylcysteine carboxylmethyltransferase family protein [Chlorobium sp.]|nr:MAG: isoprenylcysteine carboxylmethyltransferase family protein [Chlorobium sp.]
MFSAPPSYSTTLLAFMKRKASLRYRIISLSAGTILFLLLLPSLFFAVGRFFSRAFPVDWPREIEIGVACFTIPLGLFFLVWATLTQWRIGQGTPAPNAPTQRLVVEGPYKLCRNPIQLGAVLYYAGTGSLFGDLSTGLVCLLLVLIVGGGYHKFVEEKELELRFGAAYSAYRRQTPFLIPRIWKR